MTPYQDILCQVETLTPDEQLRLLEELAALVRRRMSPKTRRSIMELEGLGKETWQGIVDSERSRTDTQEYVNQERASWNG